MAPLDDIPCDSCAGRRYRRTVDGWRRCDSCWAQVMSLSYIDPAIRRAEPVPPRCEGWPLEDQEFSGDYTEFRHTVWWSLLSFCERRERVRYLFLDAWRLAEIHFGRDREYTSVRELADIPLLVLVVGLADPPNAFLPPLIQALKSLRWMYARPTWTFRGKPAARLSGSTTVAPVAVAPTLQPWD